MPERGFQENEADNRLKPVRLLCLGDSNTYGYKPFGERYEPAVRWTGRLEAAGYAVCNHGANGLPIPGAATYPALTRLVRHTAPDGITVMLGSNDLLLEGRSPEETAARMEGLLRHLQSVTAARIILIAPPPMRLGVWVPDESMIDRSRQLTERYRDLAKTMHVPFADAGDWGVTVAEDGVHFTQSGHAAFAAGLLALLEGMGL